MPEMGTTVERVTNQAAGGKTAGAGLSDQLQEWGVVLCAELISMFGASENIHHDPLLKTH